MIKQSGSINGIILTPWAFFLPFTYAIDLMREAVGGIVWECAIHDMIFLSIFGIVALLVGTFLKASINKKTNVLMKKCRDG